jgi:hypothetical protein
MRTPFEYEGFTYMRTEADNLIVGKDAYPEAIAVADLDGDGWADYVAIESPGYNYETMELIAVHGPTGRVVWRAGKGQIGKRVVLSAGVAIATGADESSLHAFDARSGAPVWSVSLPAPVLEDAYGMHGMTWNAPSIADHGTVISFGCEDGTVHVFDSRTGRPLVQREGRLLEPSHGVPGVVAFLLDDEGERTVELWDAREGRQFFRARVQTYAPMTLAADGTFYVFTADAAPKSGVPMTKVVSFDLAGKRVLRDVWVTPSAGVNVVPHNALACDPHRLAVASPDRLVLVSDDKELGGGIVIDLSAPPAPGSTTPPKPPSIRPVMRLTPPLPGYALRAVERFAQTLVAVWEHEKSHQIMAIGLDPASLEPRWLIGDAGGVDLKNHCLRTEGALLLPYAPGGKDESKAGAPVFWTHVDPTTGAKVAQYGMHEVDCARVFGGKWLLGHSTSFPPRPPVIWDLEKRERVL